MVSDHLIIEPQKNSGNKYIAILGSNYNAYINLTYLHLYGKMVLFSCYVRYEYMTSKESSWFWDSMLVKATQDMSNVPLNRTCYFSFSPTGKGQHIAHILPFHCNQQMYLSAIQTLIESSVLCLHSCFRQAVCFIVWKCWVNIYSCKHSLID